MAKGDIIQLKFEDFTDSDTGARVTRLTPVDVTCHRNYFYQKCFTNDGSKLLFGGLFDGGSWNAYLLDLKTQQARQLTDGKGKVDNTFGNFLSPDDKYLYYVKAGRELRRVDLVSLEEEVVYTVPAGYKGYGTWVANSACTKLVGIEVVEGDLLPLKTWEEFAQQYHMNPRCRLVRIDIEAGVSSVIYEQAKWMARSTTTLWPTATKARTTWLMPACGSSMKTARMCARSRSMTRANPVRTNSSRPMARR